MVTIINKNVPSLYSLIQDQFEIKDLITTQNSTDAWGYSIPTRTFNKKSVWIPVNLESNHILCPTIFLKELTRFAQEIERILHIENVVIEEI